ncbi:hypothetical protein [Riemerella anatipestifer]|uniref:Plasmid transfer protein n=2 Tax=Riemerella anatipestifer TaxID=34085 RepID=A0AAP6HEH8_RIEAN|nr:hypothetical protein [Riemerella anatipestifer]MCO7354031.1 hypothetical protein [Riemerella anatipestifer]MCU7571131.1 hypothetical protein [Riemerella anatipestifer]MCU7597592.1 hypothetical protein [Riemerella anatipestifer]MCW0494203.1 hypothetical protein [Riemerella anatipestifer]MCW0502284.1 hypothetical protein [Riemerella anatipestifer]
MKKGLLTIFLMLIFSKYFNSQSLYIDPTTTAALMYYSSELRKEQRRTRDNINDLKKAQAMVGVAMAEVGRVQDKVYKGLREVSGTLTNAYQVKEIYNNMERSTRTIKKIKDIAIRHPQYMVFTESIIKKANERITATSLELTNVLTGGDLNLMTAGDRHRVLKMVNDGIMSIRVDLTSILLRLERVERIGFWRELNPFKGYINTDRSIVENIMERYKYL